MDKYEIIFESDNIYYVKPSNYFVSDYLNLFNDKDVQLYLFNRELSFNEDGINKWINTIIENSRVVYVLIDKDNYEFIGHTEIDVNDNKAEIVIAITPLKQGNHFGTEAMASIVNYTYNTLKVGEIVLNVHKDNIKAVHIYEELGFYYMYEKNNSIYMKHRKE